MELLLSFIVSLVTQILKRFGIKEQFGDLGVHVVVIIFAFLASAFQHSFEWLPQIYRSAILETWSSAVFLYEVILKRLEPFKKIAGAE